MKRSTIRSGAAAIVVGIAALAGPSLAAPPAAPAAASAPALEPKAVEILKACSARLAAARTIRFTAIATYESPSRLGPALAYTTLSRVTLQRPDRLLVVTPGDGAASEFYYDGKTMTAFAPAENLVAVAQAPPTIDAMLKVAYESAAIYFPFTDVIVSDPWADLSAGLREAFYIGQSQIVGGTTTDMVAIAGNGVFAQLWIGAEDRLPRRIRAVYAADPGQLRNDLAFLDWKLEGDVPAEAFVASRASGATPIAFARPDPKPPAGFPKAPKGPAPTTKRSAP